MSDSIFVRIHLDHCDMAQQSGPQTRVDVYIPEVVRASWLLPAHMYDSLRGMPWQEALDAADAQWLMSGAVSDPVSESARRAVRSWLSHGENRDVMDAAWFEDAARRDPVSRSLLADVERLHAEVAELKEQRERRRERLVALQNDALNMRGSLSPNGEGRKVPFPLGETLTPAVDWLIARVAELEAAQSVVFQASRGTRLLGLYSQREDALHHCEDALQRAAEYGACPFSWQEHPDGTRELHAWTSRDVSSGTGFTVSQLEVRPEFDEGWGDDADEPAKADGITRVFAPTQAFQPEGEHYDAVHHTYLKGRDLPETGGQR